jgi:tetratricopeptide (TPR) repeat protein
MKKALMLAAIAAALLVLGRSSALALTQASSQKVIKDPAEYNAYISALNTQDPVQKASAMEAFVAQYPESTVKIDALEQAMAGYQQAGNTTKVMDMAKRLIALDPNHIRALGIATFIDRNLGTSGNAVALKEGCAFAQIGLRKLPDWQKPEGMTDTDFSKVKIQMAQIFNGTMGFCSLQGKDYVNAPDYYLKAVEDDPNDLQNVYQLSIAYLETNPVDLRGFRYGAKALALAENNAATVNAIAPYVKGKYRKYHGKADDWAQFAATVASETAPPSPEELAKLITPAATACDIAVQAVEQNDPKDLSFSDKEFILSKANCSPANKAAADKVWQSIQEMEKNGAAMLKIPVKVVSATEDSLEVAVSEDNQQASKADMHVVLEKPVLHPPAAGSMTQVVGVITDYKPDPFMFVMSQGELPAGRQ